MKYLVTLLTTILLLLTLLISNNSNNISVVEASSVSNPPYSDQVKPCLKVVTSSTKQSHCVRDVCGNTKLCYESFCDLKYPNSSSEKQRCINSTKSNLPKPALLKCSLACDTKLKFLDNPDSSVSKFSKCKKIVKLQFSGEVLKSCKNLSEILQNSKNVDESLVAFVESKVKEFYYECSQVCK